MKPAYRTGAFWIIFVMLALMFFAWNQQNKGEKAVEIDDYRELVGRIESGQVTSLEVQENKVTGVFVDPATGEEKTFEAIVPAGLEEWNALLAAHPNIPVQYQEEARPPFWQAALLNWMPILVIVFLFVLFMRNMQQQGGRAMQFAKSRARLLDDADKVTTFDDVAGVDEAKEDLEEIVAFLKNPDRFTRLGGKIPKGVLLIGPPGTGKTLLAKAVAGEAGVPFFSISGSDFVEMFVGVGASRVRDLFEQGKHHAPCIIFMDEIDAVGRERGSGLGGGHDEREQTLNQLLVELDGFGSDDHVIVMAATNRSDVLDPALLRPGRFDRRVTVNLPTASGRESILRVHSHNVPLAGDVDLETIAKGTPGMSGADLANLLNEAALLAARRDHELVLVQDMEEAKDRVFMGARRHSLVMSETEKRSTAYHEAGHAIVALKTDRADPLHKVTIVPRGQALGLTQQLPEEDRYSLDSGYLEGVVTVLMGGRAAEELVLKHTTTGVGNDIERATELARRMVTEWGMSEDIGPLAFGHRNINPFLGRDISQSRDYSETTAVAIDSAVSSIVRGAYERALTILRNNVEGLHRIAKALLDHEELDGHEVRSLLDPPMGPPSPA